jgi:protein-S-isoprenylcysteine O-methyltransferase Ste14
MDRLLILIFFFGTVALLYFSWWFSLREHRYHGLYRFLAFECILALVLINARVWFARPFSALQIASWISLTASLFLAVHGFTLLKRMGQPQGGIENTTRLIRSGAYRFIRHPLYASLILLGLGVFLKGPSSFTLLLFAANVGALVATAKVEEREMLAKFGAEYSNYMRESKMFIPFLW